MNFSIERALVVVLTVFSVVGTYLTSRSFWRTLSLGSEHHFLFTFYVFSSCMKMGFAANEVALMVSYQITGVDGSLTSNSCSKDWIYFNSVAVWARALYPYNVLGHATTFCFLKLHNTRLLPKNTHYPPVDLLLSMLLVLSASMLAARVSELASLRFMLWLSVSFMYIRTFLPNPSEWW